MKTAIITERILFKKGRRIMCYIDIMPEKIEVKTGKPSDATCISWIYQPNELERAKATATEFFDNVTRIWTLTTHEERTQEIAPFLFACSPKGKRKQQPHPKSHKDKTRGQAKDNQSKEGQKDKKQVQRDKTKGKRRKAKGQKEGKHATSHKAA